MVRYALLRPLRPELEIQLEQFRKHHQNQHNCRPLVDRAHRNVVSYVLHTLIRALAHGKLHILREVRLIDIATAS
jgi:hypothetical protein